MKHIFWKNYRNSLVGFIIISISFACACKSKQHMSASGASPQETSETPKTVGKVSHQFRSSGCSTVILVKNINEEDTLIFIPRLKLDKFDVDGLEISFNYRRLRMPNPQGCEKGFVVELSEITKK
jgi:hypothetical protein